MKLDWNEILTSKEGNFYLSIGRERDIDIFVSEKPKEKTIVKIIRGEKCTTKDSLFKEFGAALQFPPYAASNNWDSFDELINDLDLGDVNKFVLFLTNVNSLLTDNSEELDIFLEILKDAMKNWTKETRNNIPNQISVAFNIIFHCEPEFEEKCKELLKTRNIDPILRMLNRYDNKL